MKASIHLKKEFTFKTIEGYVFIDIREIVRIEASRNHTLLFTVYQREPLILVANISKIEEILSIKPELFKCHRSHIINLIYLLQFKEKPKLLITQCGEVPISEYHIKKFKDYWCN